MKVFILSLVCIVCLSVSPKPNIEKKKTEFACKEPNVKHNVIVVTLDGFRWQELFQGADSTLLFNTNFTKDTALAAQFFWVSNKQERKNKLMPFFWNLFGKKGNVYGDRTQQSFMNVRNSYGISYPGYNEMFTAHADNTINSNSKLWNPNINVLEALNQTQAYAGKVAAFTSWDAFPYILNTKRNGIIHNCAYEKLNNTALVSKEINEVQQGYDEHGGSCRLDLLTFLAAKNYMIEKKPNILYIGLGETDEYAHKGDYLNYLQKANEVDRMIAELWQLCQTIAQYKDNTSLIITTDHGRGNGKKWRDHGEYIDGSTDVWCALYGQGTNNAYNTKTQVYQSQIAPTIAKLAGTAFSTETPIVE